MPFGAEIWGPLIAEGINKQVDIQQAKNQRRWLGKMSDTAVRRRMIDLREAGLNPIMAAWGQGAQVPGGAAYASGGSPGQVLSAGIASAIALKRAKVEIRKQKIDNERAQIELDYEKDQRDHYLSDHGYRQAIIEGRNMRDSGAGAFGVWAAIFKNALSKWFRKKPLERPTSPLWNPPRSKKVPSGSRRRHSIEGERYRPSHMSRY